MALFGRAIYDFQGDESQNELTLIAGDEVVIRRQVGGRLRLPCSPPVL